MTQEYQYQGQKVHSTRDAKEGDLGYVAPGTDQVHITFEDTTHKVVLRSDLTPPMTKAGEKAGETSTATPTGPALPHSPTPPTGRPKT